MYLINISSREKINVKYIDEVVYYYSFEAVHLGHDLHQQMKFKWKITPNAPKNESGFTQLITMEKSIRNTWVNYM